MLDTKQEWQLFIDLCKENDRNVKDAKALQDYMPQLKVDKKLNLVTEWWYDDSTKAYVYQCPKCKWENRHQNYHCEGCGIKLDGVKE